MIFPEMKKFTPLLFFLLALVSYSQQKFTKQLRIQSDNDLYVSMHQDRYYTNGLFLNYRFLGNTKHPKVSKKIFSVTVGHKMYTPFKSIVQTMYEHDRPFAAYLYGGFGVDYFFKNNTVLSTSTHLGVIGPAALGWELQNLIHDMYGFDDAIGWRYQIQNALGLQLQTTYINPLTDDNATLFDINWLSKVRLGTVFTDISTGFYSRIGLKPLQKLVNSIAFSGNLNSQNSSFSNEIESFIFIHPSLHYVGYDATIQGSFLNDQSLVTYDVIPLKFTLELGLRFTYKRMHFGYTYCYHTKKLNSTQVPGGNNYGSLLVNYLFN